MPRRTWTPEIIQDARRAIEGGEPAGSVAQRLGLSPVALRNAFLRNGLQTPGTYTPKATGLPPPPEERPTPKHILREHKLRARLTDLMRERRDLLAELQEYRSALDAVAAAASAPLPPIHRRELGGGKREATAVALLSDVHGETMVKPGSTPFPNCYNLPIAEFRMRRFFDSILWQVRHARSAFHIRDLLLWVGGDLNTYHLHEENIETSQLGPNSAWLWSRAQLIAGIDHLLRRGNFAHITIPWSFGNHARTTKRMRPTTGAEHNHEWLLGCMIAEHYRNEERVSIEATTSEHQFATVYGMQLHFHHGHEIRYQGGILGIGVPVSKASMAWDKALRCDRHYYGHWHNLRTPDRYNVMNGSLIGFDRYAHSKCKADPEPPGQHFELLDSKRGPCMMTPLWVGDPEREHELWQQYEG